MKRGNFTKKQIFTFIASAFFIIALCSNVAGYAQTISTYAGNGSGSGPSGNGGPATAAILPTPDASAFDAAGNLYISQYTYGEVRKIIPSDTISTVAGNGTQGYSGNNNAATAAELYEPSGIAFDDTGNLYIADANNNVVRKVNTTGIITTIAGGGTVLGDNGPATAAKLSFPDAVAVDAANNIYIADYSNHRVRKVDVFGTITTVAGNGTAGTFTGAGGLATAAHIDGIYGITFDAIGNMYLTNGDGNQILKVNTAGIISLFAGNGSAGYSGNGGPATAAKLKYPNAVSFDAAGNMYIADTYNNVIREVNAATGIISTVVGNGSGGYSGNGGSATAAELNNPYSISFDTAGNAFITDYGNNRVREVIPDCQGLSAGSINNSTSNSFCASGSDTLSLTGDSTGIGITYQWLSSTNGTTWTNTGTHVIPYFTGTLSGTTYYKAIATCGGTAGIHDTTLVDTITINQIVAPTVSISPGPGDTICAGTSVTFTATVAYAGNNPSYQWTKNGINVGANSPIYTDNNLITTDAIICTVTSTAACSIPAVATSNTITMTVSPIVTPTVSISSGSGSSICSGTNVTFIATPTNGGIIPSYQWMKNNTTIAGATNVTYEDNSLNNTDAITCTLSSTAACATTTTAVSNTITMAVTNTVTPTVSISSSPISPVCAGSTVTFTATPDGGGSNPSYQWTKNGVTQSSTIATYTDNSLNNNDAIVCVLTSNSTCATTLTATSNTLTMAVNPITAPTVNITASATTICTGTSVTFTAAPANGGTNPSYHWTKNGNTVTGTGNSYTNNDLNNNDAITCTLTSDAACAIPATATSNTITMTVNPVVIPIVSITSDPVGGTICGGATVTFTATDTGAGIAPSYQWTNNGTPITGATNTTYSSTTLGSNNAIACILTSSATCAMPAAVTSNAIMLAITPVTLSSLSISTTPGDTICAGSSASFTATLVGATTSNFQWSVNGINVPGAGYGYASNSLNNNDVVACTIINTLVCGIPAIVSDSVTMTVFPVIATPAVSISASPSDTICAGTSVTYTATTATGGIPSSYQWIKNGVLVGANSPTYTDNNVAYNDSIICTLTENVPCASDTVGASNTIIITAPFGAPVASIVASPGTSVSAGQPVTFTATATNAGTATYQWQNDGVNIPGATANLYTTSTLENNAVIACIVHSSLCANPDSVNSNQLLMQVSTGILPITTNNDNIRMYPNPNAGSFTIVGSINNSKQAKIEILNVIGQVVYNTTTLIQNGAINNQVQLSNDNANGIYMLRITTDNGSSVIRFVMER